MNLLVLLAKEIKQSFLLFIGLIVLTGLTSAIIVSLINKAAEHIVDKDIQQEYFVLFLICATIFYFSRDYIFNQAIIQIEAIVTHLRQRLGNKIRQLSLKNFEQEAKNSLYARLTQDVLYISAISFHLIGLVQAIITIIFMLIYISLLSGWAFLLFVIAILCSALAYSNILKQLKPKFSQLSKAEPDFLEKLNHLIKGFKEIKINYLKSDAVFKNYQKAGHRKKEVKIQINRLYNKAYTYSQIILYISIAAIIFIVPLYQEDQGASILKIIAAMLFIIGPFEIVLRVLPRLAYADNAAINILKTEKELNLLLKNQVRQFQSSQTSAPLTFKNSIELKGLIYEYDHNKEYSFRIGPINLTFNKGEIIFITGGNGSGKSTFLKLLTGLYTPTKGFIYMNGDSENQQTATLITSNNYNQYNNMFTTVFTDFHLFNKLYGLPKTNEKMVNKVLKSMGLSWEKTNYQNEYFTNTDLSSGQKKRLALAVSILEDKDIYIFDEVAADLDPDFKNTYYSDLLDELRARNKTVFVVSHDKNYWKVADRVLILKNGQFTEKKRT